MEIEISNEKMILPFYKMKTCYNIPLPYRIHNVSNSSFTHSRWLGYMVYDKQTQRIFITDREEKIIRVFDENGNTPFNMVKHDDNKEGYTQTAIHGYNPEGLLKRPVAICINSYNDILVGDHERNEILVFNSYLNKCLGAFGKSDSPDECINKPSCMAIDEDNTNVSRLYVTDWWSNMVSVWMVICTRTSDSLQAPKKYSGTFIKKLNVIAPSCIKVTNDRVIVISEPSWTWIKDPKKPDLRQIEKLNYGLNCIIVYDKQSYREINRIQLSTMFNYRGLHIGSDNFIYTTAYELDLRPIEINKSVQDLEINFFTLGQDEDRKALINNLHEAVYNGRHISKNMYLCVLKMDGTLVNKIELSFEFIGDFLVFEDKKRINFISQRDSIGMHIVQFE